MASASTSSVLLLAHLRVPIAIPSQFRFHPPVSSSMNLNRFATLALSTAAAPSSHHHGSLHAAALEASISAEDESSFEAARRLYIGNIPRTVDNAELAGIVAEHGTVEKAEQIGGREIKVNVTEKPLTLVDLSLLQAEESQFIDSPHKVYVGNLAKSVTTETLKQFFSQNGNVISAKVSRVPGTSKSTGFGFVTFSLAEEVEAAISLCNDVNDKPHKDHAYPAFFRHHKRVFVFFGDSYAVTGNSWTSEESWKVPYGMTFPGHPSGQYSDGLVLTDFFCWEAVFERLLPTLKLLE